MKAPWFWRSRIRPMPGIEDHYQRLVARKGRQTWTNDDVADLKAKVQRLAKGNDGSIR